MDETVLEDVLPDDAVFEDGQVPPEHVVPVLPFRIPLISWL